MRLIQTVKERIMKNGLPEGYTRLEYLQSTGVQYIDTGFVPTSDNFKFEIRMFSQNTSAYLGYRSVNSGTATGDMRWFFNYNDGRVAIRYGDGTENSTLSFNTQTTHKFYFNGSSLYVDDVNYLTTTKKYATPVYKSFYLFSVNASGYYSTDIANFVGRIYYTKIWDNDTLVRDFIPALDQSNKPCMYDLVSKQPFYNQGTGADFSIGKKLTPVEYLELTGTQYIDTGIQPTDTYGYRIKNTYTAGQGEQCAIGCMNNGNRFVGIYTSGSANAISGAWGDYVGFLPSYTWTTGTILDVKCNYKNSRKMIIDNTEIKDISDIHITGTISNTIYIGARHYGSNVTKMQGKIYGVKITKGQEVIANYVPVRDENNVGYLLDLLTNTLYANAGSGSFAIGEDDLFVRNIGKTKFFKQTTRKVPRGFQEVEYLESTGTQYIDIGLKGKNNLDFEYKCEFTNLDGTAQCVGGNWSGQSSSTVSMYFGLIRTNGNFAYHYDGTASPVVVMNTTIQGTPYSVQGHLWKGEQYFVINGTKSSVGTIASEFTSPLNMYLFGINNNGLANPAYIKLHYFKLWDNETLVRDFVPYLDASGRPCMWDMVEGKPYYNLGTGEFTYGRKIIPVEYLESSGTQYIDTGVSGNNPNLKIEVDAKTYEFGWCYQNNANGAWVDAFSFPNDNLERVNYRNYTLAKDFEYDRVTRKTRTFDFKTGFYIDGVLKQAFVITNYSQLTPNLSIFGRYNFNSNSYTILENSSYTIYSTKIYDNNTLVRDFIPCIDENNIPYMFDKVTHSAFLNQGTGDFLYGNPVGQKTETLRVLPSIRHLPLNYLEATGTQYINTGLLSTANSKVDCVFGFSSMESGAVNNVGVFGGRNGQQSTTFTLFKIASGTPQYFRFDFNGQPQVATANQMTWDTTSKYRFEYNGTKYTTTNTTTSQSVTANLSPSSTFTTSSICLFAVNTNGTIGQYLSGRIYHYWYTDGTNTIDLYPVLKLPERIPCMYDRVSKTYFYNESTDPFLYG